MFDGSKPLHSCTQLFLGRSDVVAKLGCVIFHGSARKRGRFCVFTCTNCNTFPKPSYWPKFGISNQFPGCPYSNRSASHSFFSGPAPGRIRRYGRGAPRGGKILVVFVNSLSRLEARCRSHMNESPLDCRRGYSFTLRKTRPERYTHRHSKTFKVS